MFFSEEGREYDRPVRRRGVVLNKICADMIWFNRSILNGIFCFVESAWAFDASW